MYLLRHFINQCFLEELLLRVLFCRFINHVSEKYFMTWEKMGTKLQYDTVTITVHVLDICQGHISMEEL